MEEVRLRSLLPVELRETPRKCDGRNLLQSHIYTRISYKLIDITLSATVHLSAANTNV